MIKGISSNNPYLTAAYALSKGVSLAKQRRENPHSSETRALEKSTKDTISVLKASDQGKNSQDLISNIKVVQNKVHAYKPSEQSSLEINIKESSTKQNAQKHIDKFV